MGYEIKEETLPVQQPQLSPLVQPLVQNEVLEIQRIALEKQRVALAEAKAEADRAFEHQIPTDILNAKLAKMQELQQQQMHQAKQLQEHHEAQTRTMMQMMANMQAAMRKSDLLTTTGVEMWVIDDEISADFPESAKWRWPLASEGRGRLEDDYEQHIRSRIRCGTISRPSSQNPCGHH